MTGGLDRRPGQEAVDFLRTRIANNEEESKKAMVDVSRLSGAEFESRLASKRQIDAETASSRGAVSEMQTINPKDQTVKRGLEAAIHTVSAEIDATLMATKRAERKAKELQFALGEDKKSQDRMSELANKLQAKIKTYKQQIEEAEEIATLNLAKFRKSQATNTFPKFNPFNRQTNK